MEVTTVLQAAFQLSPMVMPSPGRSGAKFFISRNKKFYVKTIESEDIEKLHNILPQYHHVSCPALFNVFHYQSVLVTKTRLLPNSHPVA